MPADKRVADLHVHTRLSDGTFFPEEVVELASKHNLDCIAITDHDCVDAIEPALKASEDYSVEIIPAVELTAEINEKEVHLLGFFIDWKVGWFRAKLKEICKRRVERALAIIEKLKKFSINLDAEEVFRESGPGCIGRLHLARVMHKKGYVSSLNEAFRKYIGDNGPCYESKFNMTPKEAMDIIKRVGGVPVLAHPYTLGDDRLIKDLAADGLRGLEVYHSDHSQNVALYYINIAEKNNLLITGGSDCHGMGKGRILIGNVKVPYELVEKLRQESIQIRNTNKLSPDQ